MTAEALFLWLCIGTAEELAEKRYEVALFQNGTAQYFRVEAESNPVDASAAGGRDFLLWGEPGRLPRLVFPVFLWLFPQSCDAAPLRSTAEELAGKRYEVTLFQNGTGQYFRVEAESNPVDASAAGG